jgi:hypothetical protein
LLVRLGAALLCSVLCSCSDDPVATAASPLRLTATVSPNPLSAPSVAGDVFYDLELRASGSGSILLDRGDVQLLAASGAKVGHTQEFWMPSANCTVCTAEVRIAAGKSERWSRKRVHYVGGEAPVRLVYTLSWLDDRGPGTTIVEVPVR